MSERNTIPLGVWYYANNRAHRTLKQLAADKVETKKNDLNDATRDISKSQSRLEDKASDLGLLFSSCCVAD